MALDQIIAPFADILLGFVLTGIDILAQWITDGVTSLLERLLS